MRQDLETKILAAVVPGSHEVEILLDGEVIYPKGALHRVDFGWLETCTGRSPLSVHRFDVCSNGQKNQVTWLRPAAGLVLIDARSRSLTLSFTSANIEAIEELAKEGEVEARVEVAPLGPWRSSRRMKYKVEENKLQNFAPLPVIEKGATGVTIQDLEAATWYNLRLRIKYSRSHIRASALSEPITVATRCAPPDAPVPRPRVLQVIGQDRPRLKVSWAPPAANGYPILRYALEQRECIMDNDPNRADQAILLHWTNWRQVHSQLLPEYFVRPPSHDPAALIVAQAMLGFTDFSTGQDHRIEETPRFVALEFRVAAINALGASAFSEITRVTRQDCPRVLDHSCPKLSMGADKSPTRSFATEAKLQQLARALDFPVNSYLLHNALLQLQPNNPNALMIRSPSAKITNKKLCQTTPSPDTNTKSPVSQKRPQNQKKAQPAAEAALLPAQRNLMVAIRANKHKADSSQSYYTDDGGTTLKGFSLPSSPLQILTP